MSDRLEQRIRQLMAELRRQDRLHTRPFADLLQAASDANRPESRWRPGWLVPLGLTAAAATLAGILVWGSGTDGYDHTVYEGELAEWVAPSTKFLGLDDSLLDPGPGARGFAAPDDVDLWSLPTDVLIEDADDSFGREM